VAKALWALITFDVTSQTLPHISLIFCYLALKTHHKQIIPIASSKCVDSILQALATISTDIFVFPFRIVYLDSQASSSTNSHHCYLHKPSKRYSACCNFRPPWYIFAASARHPQRGGAQGAKHLTLGIAARRAKNPTGTAIYLNAIRRSQ
jgi:hypothetical protein